MGCLLPINPLPMTYYLSRRHAPRSMRLAAIVIFVVEVDVLHWQEICISELGPLGFSARYNAKVILVLILGSEKLELRSS